MSTTDSSVLSLDRDPLIVASQSPFSASLNRLLSMSVMELSGILLVFSAAFFNLVNFNVDKDVVALDLQVLAKLAIIGGCYVYGMIGVLGDLRVRRVILSFPVFFITLLVGFYFLASVASIKPKHSFVSALSLLSVLLTTVTAMVQVGLLRVLAAVFHAMGMFVVFSWVAYFLLPEVGVFMEPTTNGEFTRRMSGLAHSNTLGQYSGLTLAVGVVLYHFYGQRSTYRIIIMGLAAAALVASLSRTSLVATVVALIFAYRDRFSISSRNVGIGLAAAIVGLVGLMFMSTQVDFGDLLAQKMTAVSKSGDAEELTSATGRSQIWAYSIKLIMDQPLTGYGATTSKYFLSEYSMYTHNLVLNIAFSTGIFGGLIGLVMVLQQALGLVFHRHRITNAIVAFVLVNGLFENLIFSILAGMPTMIWVMALAWKQVADINGGEHGVRAMSLKERLA